MATAAGRSCSAGSPSRSASPGCSSTPEPHWSRWGRGRDRRGRLGALRGHVAARDAGTPRAAHQQHEDPHPAAQALRRGTVASPRHLGDAPALDGVDPHRRDPADRRIAVPRPATCQQRCNQLPTSAEARQGADLLQAQFPQVGQNTIAVVVDFKDGAPTSPTNVAAAYQLAPAPYDAERRHRVRSYVTVEPSATLTSYQVLYSQPRNALAPSVQTVLTTLTVRASPSSTSPTRTSSPATRPTRSCVISEQSTRCPARRCRSQATPPSTSTSSTT